MTKIQRTDLSADKMFPGGVNELQALLEVPGVSQLQQRTQLTAKVGQLTQQLEKLEESKSSSQIQIIGAVMAGEDVQLFKKKILELDHDISGVEQALNDTKEELDSLLTNSTVHQPAPIFAPQHNEGAVAAPARSGSGYFGVNVVLRPVPRPVPQMLRWAAPGTHG